MCGRIVIHEDPNEIWPALYDIAQRPPKPYAPNYNVSPQQDIPVLIEHEDGARELRPMTWGLTRPGSKSGFAPINARSETVAEKWPFRDLVARSRCLVPMSGYYEWKKVTAKDKQPYYIRPTDRELPAFAGLCDHATGTFTILTTAPASPIRHIHDRMPVILRPDTEMLWLDHTVIDPAALVPAMVSYPEEWLAWWPVDKAVGNVRNNGPQLIEPVEL